jgi:hypothetical protein
MRTFDKVFIICIFVFSSLVIAFMTVEYKRGSVYEDKCSAANGVVVRSWQGDVCIKSEAILKMTE